MSERKAFNFYISYFDVYNELSEKDKKSFIEAILNRQFYGIEPTELTGLAKFAYLSQKHNIDSQVEGYENKTKTKLSKGGSVGSRQGGDGQEEGKEEEEVQYVESFLHKPTEWRNQFIKHYTINLEEYLKRLSAFELAYDINRDEKELKQHFFNWFKNQDYKKHEIVIPHWNENRDK